MLDGARSIQKPIGPKNFLDARKAHLDKVIEDVGTKTLRYIYDFGDGWEHTIKIERVGPAVPVLDPSRQLLDVDRVVDLDVARRDPLALRVELLGRELRLAQVPGAEHHRVAGHSKLPADLKAYAAVAASDHRHGQSGARWRRHRPIPAK